MQADVLVTLPSNTDTDRFDYDNASRLLTAASERFSNQVAFAYNDDSTLSSETITGIGGGAAGYTVGREYDADNRLIRITHPNGSVTERTYTDRDQLATVSYDGDLIARFDYDPAMRERSRIIGGLSRSSAYARQDNHVTGLQVGTTPGGNDRPGLGWSYSYDANKNLLDAATGGVMAGVSFATQQDDEDRLVNWTRTNGETQNWNLSLVGDWDSTTGQTFQAGLVAFSQQRSHNAVHELESIIDTVNGNPVTAVEHDAKGNITQDDTGQTYTYDFDNQLVEAKDSSGAVLGSYTYDALGRRTERTVASTGVTTAYVCLTDSSGMGQVIAEYDNGTFTRQTTYGSYVDEPLSLYFDAGPNGGQTYWYHLDRQYNVVGLSNSTQVVERYAYSPYGERRVLAADGVTVLAASAFGNARGHQGLWHDDETGLVYNRARYRSTSLGRWMGRDRLGYVDGMNLYQYLGASSLNELDPLGLCPCEDLINEYDDLLEQQRQVQNRLDNIGISQEGIDSRTSLDEGPYVSGAGGVGLGAAGAYGAKAAANVQKPDRLGAMRHTPAPRASNAARAAKVAGGVGMAIDVARTGRSLSNGDYVGAVSSASSAGLSLLPGGTALSATANATAAALEAKTQRDIRSYNDQSRYNQRGFLGEAESRAYMEQEEINRQGQRVLDGMKAQGC